MSCYIVTEAAREDILEIQATIAESNERTADRMTAKIVKQFPTLALFPETGRLRGDQAPELRSVAVRPYIIFYRPISEGVAIVRILHGARGLPSLFEG